MNITINNSFAASCQLRPISAFSVPDLLEVDLQTMRAFISSASKQLWFHQFCAEQGIKGKIVTQFLSADNLPPIPFTGAEGGTAFPVKEYWKATIFMDGAEITSAESSQTFLVHDQVERDSASNQLRNAAIGAALSQAGFGVISSFQLCAEDVEAMQKQMGDPNMIPPAPTVTTTSTTAAPAPAAPNSFFGNGVTAAPPLFQQTGPAPSNNPPAAPVFTPATNPVSAPVVNQAPLDPLAAAKATMWHGTGKYQGMTLGDILSGVSGVKNIKWIAETYVPRNSEAAAVQAAARVILESLNA